MATLPAFMPPGFVGVFASVSAAPPAATYPMQSIYVTEGTGYFCVSNGVAWLEQLGVDSATGIQYAGSTPTGLGQSIAIGGVPMILQASGTVGNNGALSVLSSALDVTYPNCYLYFAVDKIATGVAAGWYYTVMSSTTAGTVYNNKYVSGTPSIPATPVAFATTGGGAYTQVTGSIDALTATLPAGAMGVNGALEFDYRLTCTNNVNAKSYAITLGGTSMFTASLASVAGLSQNSLVKNQGKANRQATYATDDTVGATFTAVDTSIARDVVFSMTHGTAADWVALITSRITVRPAA